MNHPISDLLKVGDIIEFHVQSNPPPLREWEPEVVREIRVVEEYDDKEGTLVQSVRWKDIEDYICMVVVLGTGHWARNDQIRQVKTERLSNQNS